MEFTTSEQTIDALDRLQKALRDLIDSLEASKSEKQDLTVYAVPQANPVETSEDSPVKGQSPVTPAAKPTTLEEVRAVLCEKAREGKSSMVKMLLERFGVTRLTEADPADYAELLESGRML